MAKDFDDRNRGSIRNRVSIRNRGSIWKNEKKETDKHPDFTGSLNVDGKDYWVSAWKRKEGASPKAPALSFSVKPKDGQEPKHNESSNKPSAATRQGSMKDQTYDRHGPGSMDDEIPFAPEFR